MARSKKTRPVCFVSAALAAASGHLKLDTFAKLLDAARPTRRRKRAARVPKCPNCGIHGHDHSCIDTASP